MGNKYKRNYQACFILIGLNALTVIYRYIVKKYIDDFSLFMIIVSLLVALCIYVYSQFNR